MLDIRIGLTKSLLQRRWCTLSVLLIKTHIYWWKLDINTHFIKCCMNDFSIIYYSSVPFITAGVLSCFHDNRVITLRWINCLHFQMYTNWLYTEVQTAKWSPRWGTSPFCPLKNLCSSSRVVTVSADGSCVYFHRHWQNKILLMDAHSTKDYVPAHFVASKELKSSHSMVRYWGASWWVQGFLF